MTEIVYGSKRILNDHYVNMIQITKTKTEESDVFIYEYTKTKHKLAQLGNVNGGYLGSYGERKVTFNAIGNLTEAELLEQLERATKVEREIEMIRRRIDAI